MKRFLVLALCLSMVFATAGCSQSQFDAVLNEITPAVLDVLQIVVLFKGGTVNTTLTTKISADVTALETLDNSLTTAIDASAKAGIESDINAGFTTLNADLSSVFTLTSVSDPNSQAKITALVALIETAVNIAEATIPDLIPAAKVSPKLTASDLASSYDKILTAKTGNSVVDQYTKKHLIHNHGFFLRHLSFGITK